ncbi:MAG: phosphate ABC transporter substrate-binding protein [Actinobacteria bacterium]|nr:phosphate ABC transporter substrate-binding protein [Actinomycetota bacterium]
MRLFRKAWPVLLILGLILALAAGCTKTEEKKTEGATEKPKTEKKLTGSLKLAGSTTVLPVAQAAAEKFMEQNQGVKVEVQGTGSSEGITAVSEGAADIGNSSRDLKEAEKSLGLVDNVIAIDAIVFIVNPSNKVDGLTKEQIKDIFTGKITNWKEVGGESAPIQVVNRDEASGTREVVQKKLLSESVKFTGNAVVQPGTGQVKATVTSTPNAIGYISFGYVDSTVKGLKFDGVKPAIASVKDKTYAFQRNLHMFTKGQPSALAKAYIDFVLGKDFQKEVVAKEYIPVVD